MAHVRYRSNELFETNQFGFVIDHDSYWGIFRRMN